MSEPFIGEIRIFAGNFAPLSWAFCDGRLLPIAQNVALFSIIGTTYGGDGRTTVALPNLEGRLPMHQGRGPGLTPRTIGQRFGVETVTLTEAEMPNHTHALEGSTEDDNETAPVDNYMGALGTKYAAAANLMDMASQSLPNAGGSQSHNNIQPVLYLNFIIALQGILPSRN